MAEPRKANLMVIAPLPLRFTSAPLIVTSQSPIHLILCGLPSR
jgi:hypothetical protein